MLSYHILFSGEIVASFLNKIHRDDLLDYWKNRFSYAADEITSKDD